MKILILIMSMFYFSNAFAYTLKPIHGKIYNYSGLDSSKIQLEVKIECRYGAFAESCGRETGKAIINSDGSFTIPKVKHYSKRRWLKYYNLSYSMKVGSSGYYPYARFTFNSKDDFREHLKELSVFHINSQDIKLNVSRGTFSEWIEGLGDDYASYYIYVGKDENTHSTNKFSIEVFRINSQQNTTKEKAIVYSGFLPENHLFDVHAEIRSYKRGVKTIYFESNQKLDLSNRDLPQDLLNPMIVY